VQKSIISLKNYSKWFEYKLEERHALWKVLLPYSPEIPILAIGLKGRELASLARSYKVIHINKCIQDELKWALEDGQALDLEYHFKEKKTLEFGLRYYSCVIVDLSCGFNYEPEFLYSLLKNGGSILWVGEKNKFPNKRRLISIGFNDVREYAFLPTKKNKVLLPLENRNLIRSGLSFFRPFGIFRQIILKFINFCALLLRFRFFGIRKVLIARRNFPEGNEVTILESLRMKLGYELNDIAVYSGYTKIILKLLKKDGRVRFIAKLSDLDLGRLGLERESEVLRYLSKKSVLEKALPSVLLSTKLGSYYIQIQTCPDFNLKNYSNKLTSLHFNFLRKLSKVDYNELLLEDWPEWPSLKKWAYEYKLISPEDGEFLRLEIERIANLFMNLNIPFHRIHGDFAPKHVFFDDQNFVVVDWEDSQELGLPFYDAIHFSMQKYISSIPKYLSLRDILSNPNKYINLEEILKEIMFPFQQTLDIAKLAIIDVYRVLLSPRLRCKKWNYL